MQLIIIYMINSSADYSLDELMNISQFIFINQQVSLHEI